MHCGVRRSPPLQTSPSNGAVSMPRAEAGSAKAIGNAVKAKGLTKLRFYCQVCQKACRDQNGYKCHIESESHMRQIAALGGNANKVISDNSKEFEQGFVSLLSRRFGTARVNANKVYQEYIQERHHLHMNATRWVSLSEFVKHIGRQGICKVEEITDEGQFGWYLRWIDNSPAALARQDALQKMERAKTDEEGRMRKYFKEQIDRAQQSEDQEKRLKQQEIERKASEGLKREEGLAPVRIGASLIRPDADKAVSASPSTFSSSNKEESVIPRANPFKMANNPLRKPASTPSPAPVNAFKAATAARSSGSHNVSRHVAMTAAERIMAEELAMREKRKSMGPQPSVKRMRM